MFAICCLPQTALRSESSRCSSGLTALGDAGSSTPQPGWRAAERTRAGGVLAGGPLSGPSTSQSRVRHAAATAPPGRVYTRKAQGRAAGLRMQGAAWVRTGWEGKAPSAQAPLAGGPQDCSSGSSVGAWSPAGQEQGRADGGYTHQAGAVTGRGGPDSWPHEGRRGSEGQLSISSLTGALADLHPTLHSLPKMTGRQGVHLHTSWDARPWSLSGAL